MMQQMQPTRLNYHGREITYSEDETLTFIVKDSGHKGDIHSHELHLTEGTIVNPSHKHEAGFVPHRHTLDGSVPSKDGFK